MAEAATQTRFVKVALPVGGGAQFAHTVDGRMFVFTAPAGKGQGDLHEFAFTYAQGEVRGDAQPAAAAASASPIVAGKPQGGKPATLRQLKRAGKKAGPETLVATDPSGLLEAVEFESTSLAFIDNILGPAGSMTGAVIRMLNSM